jgi:5-methyltetrahydropteroyltriglutamate--homocysteine methyltransferase
MQRATPPFRADHVGSLLRSAALKAAREQRARGEISAEAFKEIEDREVMGVIARQEAAGLASITDGEYRRTSWNIDFLERLDNVESYAGERKIKFQTRGPQPRPILLRVIGKLGGFKPHPMIEHFKFLRAHAARTPKMTIPSPSSLHFRYGRDRCLKRSIQRWRIFIATLASPIARWCAPLPTPAAVTCNSMRSISPICAIRRCAAPSPIAAKIPRACRRSMPL